MPNTPTSVEVKRYASGSTEPSTLASLRSSAWTVDDLKRAARNHNVDLGSVSLKKDIAEVLFNAVAKNATEKTVQIERSVRVKLIGQGCNGTSREEVTVKLVDPDTDENGSSQNEEKDRVVFETEAGELFYTTVRDLAETLEALESVQYDTFGY